MPSEPTAMSPKGPASSTARWQLAWILVMLAAGFLSIAATQLALGLGLLTLIYRWVAQKQRPPATGLERTAIALALWALAMVPLSTAVAQSALYYRRFYLFAAIWVCASVADSEGRRRLMLISLLGGALVTCLHDQVQQIVRFGSLFERRMEVSFNAMTSGALLMMASLVAIGFVLTPGHSRRTRGLVSLALVPLLTGVAMTMTRSAELGLVAGVGAMLLAIRPRLLGGFLGGAGAIAIVVLLFGRSFLPPLVSERLSPQFLLSGENTELRLEMWRGGWEMIKERPVTGFGDRGLEELSRSYYSSSTDRYFGHMHSNFVHMAVIWGVPGLLLGQAFIFAGLWRLCRRWRGLRREGGRGLPFAAGWTLGAIGMWTGFFVAGLTEWYFGDAEPMLIYLAVVGIALGGNTPADPDRTPAM